MADGEREGQARRREQNHRGGRRVKPRKRGSSTALRPYG